MTIELPETGLNPNTFPEGECPWQRYARADHDSWAYRFGPSVVVRDVAVARTILSDQRFTQGIRAVMENNPDLDRDFVERRKQSMLMREGPDHQRMRRIASKAAFTPRAADRQRPAMREVMELLADRVPADGVCDAVATLTHEYPTRVISRILGAPVEDVAYFSDLVETVLNAQSGAPEAMVNALRAHEDLDDYIRRLIEVKRSNPGEDLLTDLIRAESEDGTLTSDEVLCLGVSVILAGTDTTRNQLALGLHLFADHPEQWTALDEHGLVAAAEEMIRFAPIGHALLRVPTEPVVLNDVEIPAGTMVILDVGAANRDPAVIETGADDFDTTRAPLPHLGFGHGHKYCLGANLAKAELVEALRVLRERFSAIEHAGETVWRHVGFVHGPIELPLRFTHARS